MKRPPRVAIVVNPAAGAGSALRLLPRLETALQQRRLPYNVLHTRAPGDGARVAGEVIAGGDFDVLAVVGGDGTLNEVVQAFVLHTEGDPLLPSLAVVRGGTGGDFFRSLGLRSVDDVVTAMCERTATPCDLGFAEFRNPQGRTRERAFLNVASLGISADVTRRVQGGSKRLGGRLEFLTAAVRALVGYQNIPVSVRVDGATVHEGPVVCVAIANGGYFGGGFNIAREARIDDGALDVVVIPDLGKLEVLTLAPALLRGKHAESKHVRVARGRVVEVSALGEEPHELELDGENVGLLPARIKLLPNALRVFTQT